ncbi:hypothetical protein [Rhodovulum sulfidophilum]|uniref:hypothetical protein n=1 Tax=Rhodovulum sulfidophilum TaxID=35806 RepID=UPI00095242C6|nr:hypothetical protein [Rhodovulum sulfidophilum]OLS42821.1 hypothetical protein BV392_19415 [Rhodovulum sulfidophilum]
MHLSDPQEGAIDAEFRLASLISAVFLNVCLCNDTVAANIRMARSDASEAGLRTSVETAHSEGAGRLRPAISAGGLREASGKGSRSRPLPKDAPIVIHDALLAILASESEPSAQRGLEAVVPDKAVVMIAHRVSTVQGATGRWCRMTVGGRIRAVMPSFPAVRAATGGYGRRRCGPEIWGRAATRQGARFARSRQMSGELRPCRVVR